jgi:hypothetical protein
LNDSEIYSLPENEDVVIPVYKNNPKIVLTDGYHYTKPLELVYHHLKVYYFKVGCVIDNFQLLAGVALMALLYLLGLFTGFFILKVLSVFPIIYFLFYYYINREDFIKIRPS